MADGADYAANRGAAVAGAHSAAIDLAELRRRTTPEPVTFQRRELDRILQVYSRMVAEGHWRDYAIDHLRDRAVFSAFRRASEVPLYRIEKDPSRARKQGAFAIISAAGLVLKRGHELDIVLKYFDKAPRLVR
ncbi:MAG: DUF2794 domain-containing protein [Hoeflea sp.]|nr:DUF2794 domain-containing protein [Alphaproteobacteria bacterium]MBU4547179.1 DUF2794 domain-containing protein [Alphaproteobacteria bacterium]MBU4548792.1 DUF2794 domain-containing protein [Alphaproteobacteria bacterium]MBV1722292.1 DUF2794 domain-containing protein [Hoeflea sp.]MBV1762551.1 DUF2794 domain-containing protein [Hoeflea sp.]